MCTVKEIREAIREDCHSQHGMEFIEIDRVLQWEMRPNALLLCLFGTNCNIFLMFTFRFIGKCHFECSIVQ